MCCARIHKKKAYCYRKHLLFFKEPRLLYKRNKDKNMNKVNGSNDSYLNTKYYYVHKHFTNQLKNILIDLGFFQHPIITFEFLYGIWQKQ